MLNPKISCFLHIWRFPGPLLRNEALFFRFSRSQVFARLWGYVRTVTAHSICIVHDPGLGYVPDCIFVKNHDLGDVGGYPECAAFSCLYVLLGQTVSSCLTPVTCGLLRCPIMGERKQDYRIYQEFKIFGFSLIHSRASQEHH